MTRTIKGSKGPGFEYWSPRPGNKHGAIVGKAQKVQTHRTERARARAALQGDVKCQHQE